MKKSRLATLLVFLVLIPLTLLLGKAIPGRHYYITVTLMIGELMLPFFLAFEGRKPQARELALLAVMCALAIAARVVFPIPHFKAVFAVIIIAAIAFGPEAGFMVGAITAFASNFFYGQGPFTPWQMMAYGAGGMLAGFAFSKGKLPQKPWVMAVFGFVTVLLWIGPLMDCSSIFLMLSRITWKAVVMVFASGFFVNCCNALTTAAVLFFLGKPLLQKLHRIQEKYGLLRSQ